MKILGIDYGEKRVGLAIGDKTVKITRALEGLENKGKSFVIEKIRNICIMEDIGEVIMGLPLGMSGKETRQTETVKNFINDLRAALDIPIISEDERLTTRMATESLQARGIKRERKKKRIDSVAAQLILQGYLEKIKKQR